MNRSRPPLVKWRPTARYLVIALLVLALSVVAAACGGGGSSSSESSSASTETTATETTSSGGQESSALAAAKAMIAPYVGKPSPFPVTEKLKEVPKGATIAFGDLGTPIGQLQYEILEQAAKVMGVKLARVKIGPDAKTTTTGMESIVEMKPAAVIVAGPNIEIWKNQLEELQSLNIPVVTTGVIDTEPYGLEAVNSGNAQDTRAGQLLASYAFAEMNPEANIVVYEIPELAFTKLISQAFVEQIEESCPKCTVRTAKIQVTEVGSTAPNTIVSDLQAHQETNLAVFTIDEMTSGLPTALKTAGINDVETLGYAPGPVELQYLKEGSQTAALGYDIGVSVWSLLDMAARQIVGQKLTGEQAKGYSVNQFLTPEDITFDPSHGWTGYPEFEKEFEELWGVGG